MTIARNDGTIVALMLLKPMSPKPTFGSAKGLIKILDGFDDPIDGFGDVDESAQLYAEIYAEDSDLQGLTVSAMTFDRS